MVVGGDMISHTHAFDRAGGLGEGVDGMGRKQKFDSVRSNSQYV